MKKKKFVIIGCGYIGKKRSKIIQRKSKIVYCIDKNKKSAEFLAKKFKCSYSINVDDIFRTNFDAAIVAVPHSDIYDISKKLINKKKHILIEKPGAKNLNEIKNLYFLAKNKKIIVSVGYNLRFHDSIIDAQKMIQNGIIGNLMYVRARYGHGARLGYNKEWRMNKRISGGGQMIDQGSHLIDLSRIFLGEFDKVKGILKNYFWKSNVEDNAFMVLENKKNKKVAFLHTSCTEWKNIFSFEIFGKKGKILIEGLNGSYGLEKLTLYKMKKKMGKPRIKSFIYKKDNSFVKQHDEFLKCVESKKNSNYLAGLPDAIKVFKIIDKIYKNDFN